MLFSVSQKHVKHGEILIKKCKFDDKHVHMLGIFRIHALLFRTLQLVLTINGA